MLQVPPQVIESWHCHDEATIDHLVRLLTEPNSRFGNIHSAFTAAGLHVSRKRRKPLSSNFKELTAAAKHLGLTLHRRAFEGWASIQAPTILKVSGGRASRKGNWHWVVAHRSPYGVQIQDPGIELTSYENPPPNCAYIDFSIYEPTGHILTIGTSDATK